MSSHLVSFNPPCVSPVCFSRPGRQKIAKPACPADICNADSQFAAAPGLASRSAASAGIPHGCNAAPRFTLPHSFTQSTFHSRMTDAACSSPRYGWCRRYGADDLSALSILPHGSSPALHVMLEGVFPEKLVLAPCNRYDCHFWLVRMTKTVGGKQLRTASLLSGNSVLHADFIRIRYCGSIAAEFGVAG